MYMRAEGYCCETVTREYGFWRTSNHSRCIIKKVKYVIGNWKSNQNISQSLIWLDGLSALHPKFSPEVTVILCLPFTDIASFNHKISDLNLPIISGSQNVSHLAPGKHTGEITANMLSELVNYCIVGHSERRQEFSETSEIVAQKARLLLESSITPIICLDTPYLDEQIKALFTCDVDVSRCFFVYEPISAIGIGKPIDSVSANHIANQIAFLTDNAAPILYGGSVSSDNAASFVRENCIDGVLVGTDSLEPTLFAGIITSLS
ncbi:MAG: Triosephosphate isomerase [Candidatus Collierbacteria bacterium GW2011_GWB1_45_35]|uniref:Triosephosphate isomerase n=1 Tax=Candidatus Collierbacteria bacterium GW2011_GWB2_45_17 TaxID=1618388 RepID=A0A837IFR7_9BACT|nr:MAG: Triosephosphate isomerase [Microgenomates group bacterium GW2011_GWC1_44_23]KKT95995.1 MAG: Triosephosphate isomerase [Candidatus Collierbacteria bacterium GW2011_GWA1_45_15]KKU01132.1 MAG: Triosephosphate isomerase [Candidatus Collierbacteria bacterium GW2011_GWB2_45_17]KKU05744.1 MAG: Triosephosphate isomerase [Candidatus Collierbacteria bacterium GW2011_GWB1_45_35]KKU08055.1 MAG: Triosephosphate isomerase [Candidatus Collierbacteria bacterium GW2011_GWC2_45_40]HBC45122.1 hypothetica